MLSWLAMVSSSKYFSIAYPDVRDRMSLAEVVDHIHLHNGLVAMESAAQKPLSNTKVPRR